MSFVCENKRDNCNLKVEACLMSNPSGENGCPFYKESEGNPDFSVFNIYKRLFKRPYLKI